MDEHNKPRQGAEVLSSQMQANNEVTIDLGELFHRLLIKWKLIACLALAFAIVFGAYTKFFVTPMYQATSTIYVLNRKDSAISISDLNMGTALAADYVRVFNMWEVHEQVISNLNLPYTYTQISKMISVANTSNTRMLDIHVKSPNPVEAAAIANEYAQVASVYIEETMSTDRPNLMSVARVPANPVSPSLSKNIVLGFLLGAVLAAGIVVVQMLLDDKYKTAEDIRRYTGLVNLAVVPDEDVSLTKRKEAKHL